MSAYKVNCSQMHIQSKVQATKWKLEIIWFKVQNPYACLKRLWYYMIWLKLIDLFFLIMVTRFVCCSCKGYTFQRKDVLRKTCALIYYPFIYSGNPLHNYYLKCTSIYMWKWYSWLVQPHFECDGHQNLNQVSNLSLVPKKCSPNQMHSSKSCMKTCSWLAKTLYQPSSVLHRNPLHCGIASQG